MKRNAIKLVFVSMLMVLAINAFAGSLDTLSNQSAAYLFDTAQNASTDGAGIVPYNPAGTALLDKGFYLDVSNQTLLKFYSQSEDVLLKDTYELNAPTPFLPNMFLAYNFGILGAGKLSVYGQAGVCAGGGSLPWEDGTVGTNGFAASGAGDTADQLTTGGIATSATGYSSTLEGSSIYYGLGAGVGYSLFDDKLSASAGVRYTMAERSAKISGTMNFYTAAFGPNANWSVDIVDDYEYSAAGFTPIFGLDIRPVDKLTIGVRYEMETELEFDYKTNEIGATPSTVNPGTTPAATGIAAGLPNYDGTSANQNLPQVISVGAEYVFSPKFTASAGSTFYLMSNADLEGGEDGYGLGFELSASAKYQATDKLMLGGTFMHTRQAVEDSLWEDDGDALLTVSGNPPLDSMYFGLGCEYAVLKNVDLVLGGTYVYYLPEDITTDGGMEVSYEKTVINLGIGVKCKL